MKKDINDVCWKLENGDTIRIMDMEEKHFQLAYQVLQKRQLKAYQSLVTNIKREEAFKEAAKLRKIKIISLAESEKKSSIVRDFIKARTIISSIASSIKRKLKQLPKEQKNEVEKIQIVLQEAEA